MDQTAAVPPDLGLVVRLELPASPRYLSAARVVAASLGADAGLTVDDLEDLRLGVNEMVTAMVDGADGSARISLDFVADDHAVTVSGRIEGQARPVAPDELTGRILTAVADHYELGSSSFVLTKASSLRERT